MLLDSHLPLLLVRCGTANNRNAKLSCQWRYQVSDEIRWYFVSRRCRLSRYRNSSRWYSQWRIAHYRAAAAAAAAAAIAALPSISCFVLQSHASRTAVLDGSFKATGSSPSNEWVSLAARLIIAIIARNTSALIHEAFSEFAASKQCFVIISTTNFEAVFIQQYLNADTRIF